MENVSVPRKFNAVWICAWPKCPRWKQAVDPGDRGRCPECGRTVYALPPDREPDR